MPEQWHTDFTRWDRQPRQPVPPDLDAILQACDSRQENAQVIFGIIGDFLFVKMGRPRWFLSAEMAQVLLHSKIESQSLQGIPFPYDSFNLVFEKGVTLASEHEVKFISVCNPRSALAAKLGGAAMRAFGKRFNNHPFEDSFYLGGLISRAGTETVFSSVLPLSMPLKEGMEIINRQGNVVQSALLSEDLMEAINDQIVKIAVASVFYFNARPDLYVAHALSRDQRYKFPGDASNRANMRRVMLPTEKKVQSSPAATHGTGTSKRPHYRGFVLRTLRDERYERNQDGSFKTVLVEPTAIHPELMNDEPS